MGPITIYEAPPWRPQGVSAELFVGATKAMATLPPHEREALLLWNAGMDYREISDRTNQSAEVVGAVLAQARDRLMMADDLLEM